MNFSEINNSINFTTKQPLNDESKTSSNINYKCKSTKIDQDRIFTGPDINKNDLSLMFFSEENMKRLQKQIKQEVYTQTKGQYKLECDQDNSDLFIIMKAIYLSQGKYLPNNIVRQVKQLNKLVIDEIIPDMITNIKNYYGYIQEINKPKEMLPLPINVNNAGRRTLPTINTIRNM